MRKLIPALLLALLLTACGAQQQPPAPAAPEPAQEAAAEEPKQEEPPKEEPKKEEPEKVKLDPDAILASLQAHESILRADRIAEPQQYEGRMLVYSIRYAVDDCEVEGYVAVPAEVKPELAEGLPGLIYCRGGNRSFSPLEPLDLYRQAFGGYAVFGSQYRGNFGGTGKEDFGGDDVHDLTKLVDVALDMDFVTGEKVYLVGFSRGGMMAYRVCQDYGDKIQACAVNSGLADSYLMYETREQAMKDVYHQLVGGGPDELPEAFDRRSATHFADEINGPILIGQGTKDVRVVPQQAYDMADALKAAGKVEDVDYKLIIYEGAQHGLSGTTFMRDQLQWFSAHAE